MRVARAFRLPITAVMAALALSGCMRTAGPVAVAQPQGDLDSMAYGQTYARLRSRWRIQRRRDQRAARPLRPRRAAPTRRARHLCGARRACQIRRGLSSRRRRQAARRGLRPGRSHQHLCDRCRRLDHDAADRLGAGARTHAGRVWPPRSPAKLRAAISAIPRSRSRSKPIGRSSSSAKSQRPASIPTFPT